MVNLAFLFPWPSDYFKPLLFLSLFLIFLNSNSGTFFNIFPELPQNFLHAYFALWIPTMVTQSLSLCGAVMLMQKHSYLDISASHWVVARGMITSALVWIAPYSLCLLFFLISNQSLSLKSLKALKQRHSRQLLFRQSNNQSLKQLPLRGRGMFCFVVTSLDSCLILIASVFCVL